MKNLSESYNNLKNDYRKIFLECASDIEDAVLKLKPENFQGEIFDVYQDNSEGKSWQNTVLKYLDNVLKNDVSKPLQLVKNNRKNSCCVGCGACCKFACSEFSYSQLKQKAESGDEFASQFISVFDPYKFLDDVKKIYPEYVDFLMENFSEGFYFYHCPRVTEDNRCPDYNNRPQICKDFPDNPLAFLPPTCGFFDWKLKSERVLLKLNALAEIVEFYKNNIEGNK